MYQLSLVHVVCFLNWWWFFSSSHILITLPLAPANEETIFRLKARHRRRGRRTFFQMLSLSLWNTCRCLVVCLASAHVERNFPLQAALVTVKYGKHAKAMPGVTQSTRTKPRVPAFPRRHNYLFFAPLFCFCFVWPHLCWYLSRRGTQKKPRLSSERGVIYNHLH